MSNGKRKLTEMPVDYFDPVKALVYKLFGQDPGPVPIAARITVGEPKEDLPLPDIIKSFLPKGYSDLKYAGTQKIYQGRVPLPTYGKQHIQNNIIDFDFNGNLKMMPVLVKTPAYPSGYPQFIPMGISKTQYVLRGDWSKVRDGSGFKVGQLLHFWVYSYNHLLDKKKKMKDDYGCDDWIYMFEKAAIEKNPDQLYMPRLCVIVALASQDGEAAAAALGENLEVGESSRGQTGDELQDGELQRLSLLSNVCGAFAQESVMPPGQMGGEEELRLRNEVADLREKLASIGTRYTNELQFLHQQIDEKNARLRTLVQIETAEIDETPNA